MTTLKVILEIDSSLKDLIPNFLSHLKRDIAALESSLNARQLEDVINLAHRLRGDAPGFGFIQVGEICGELEDNAQEGQLHECESLVASLINYVANVEIKFVEN